MSVARARFLAVRRTHVSGFSEPMHAAARVAITTAKRGNMNPNHKNHDNLTPEAYRYSSTHTF